MGLEYAGRVALFKHITQYGQAFRAITTGASYNFFLSLDYSKKNTREESQMSNFHTTPFQNNIVLVS
jgi:hypothetical protein